MVFSHFVLSFVNFSWIFSKKATVFENYADNMIVRRKIGK